MQKRESKKTALFTEKVRVVTKNLRAEGFAKQSLKREKVYFEYRLGVIIHF